MESTIRYQVKEVAAIANISPRTLHYYDEIGLLSPSAVGENGYRYYDQNTLIRLQQIILHLAALAVAILARRKLEKAENRILPGKIGTRPGTAANRFVILVELIAEGQIVHRALRGGKNA